MRAMSSHEVTTSLSRWKQQLFLSVGPFSVRVIGCALCHRIAGHKKCEDQQITCTSTGSTGNLLIFTFLSDLVLFMIARPGCLQTENTANNHAPTSSPLVNHCRRARLQPPELKVMITNLRAFFHR